jgi:hypothetical protein
MSVIRRAAALLALTTVAAGAAAAPSQAAPKTSHDSAKAKSSVTAKASAVRGRKAG